MVPEIVGSPPACGDQHRGQALHAR
uniref:Uncharacterized protein n=1 Tax=Arundo donax TaxID=35708 RepID=A0A0A8YDB7_ARUDO